MSRTRQSPQRLGNPDKPVTTGYLLDTRVVLWALGDSERLGPVTRAALLETGARVYVSAVSTWELRVKAARGKVTFPDDLEAALARAGMRELPIRQAHVALMTEPYTVMFLTPKDPFDQLLVAQARVERLELVTADPAILKLGLPIVRDARE